jgi:hypothetical protein
MPTIHPTDDFDEDALYRDLDGYQNGSPPNLQMPPKMGRLPTMDFPQAHEPITPSTDVPHHQPHRHAPRQYGSITSGVLAKYYRIPGPHVRLATRGAFMPRNSIELTANGDIPVYPMRAADEMILKSPDALMSGLAIERLFESCIPAIKAPRLISTPDIDVLLLAIRVATYGDKMTMSTTCPKCKEENTYDCDLPALLSTMRYTETDGSVRLSDGVVVYVRPYNLDNATKMALVAFEETRRLQALDNAVLDGPTRAAEVSLTMERITSVNQTVLVDCVYKVAVEEGVVVDKEEIRDFIMNIPKPWAEKLDAKIKTLNDSGIDKSIHAVCSSCQNEWDTEVEFNPENFFDEPSSV